MSITRCHLPSREYLPPGLAALGLPHPCGAMRNLPVLSPSVNRFRRGLIKFSPHGTMRAMNKRDTRAQLLHDLRIWMNREGLDAFIVPSSDPHQGEYVPLRYQTRAYISGFTGSAGTVVITATEAGLWTDFRYFLEAAAAVEDSPFVLHRQNTPGTSDYPQWLSERLEAGDTVGFDGSMATEAWYDSVRRILGDRGVLLKSTADPFEDLWPDRPDLPAAPVESLDVRFTGESAHARITRIRRELRRHDARAHVVSTLDDIAWILNLRGNDVEFNPVFLAYLLIPEAEPARLYTEPTRLRPDALTALKAADVEVREYERFPEELESFPGPVMIDPDRTSHAVAQTLGSRLLRVQPQPSTVFKARKNTTEIRCLKTAHERDGVAMVRFLAWLDRTAREGSAQDELTLASKLREFRAADPAYVSDSFAYVSGLNGNGAIVHYSTTRESAAKLEQPAIYLTDSGAQYRDGTTDITRTVAIDATGGAAVVDRFPEVREDFTLILKGHIALARLIFPVDKPGREIDAIARVPLWARFRNYGHGTGHGVGYFLNVHEGPQKIAPGGPDYPLEAGMLCSNEPGLYRTGLYGIRTENLVLVQHASDPSNPEETPPFGEFLSFETISLCPIDRRLVDPSLLTAEERAWVDRYHRRVREALGEFLSREDREWLEGATAPLEP
ncbi:MAG: aminopeptidase P family protein [Spirochaetaceae bacterium]|nr:MAG: aminopeptidase P family protein [Spirochaetaceae bacterium]